MPFPYEPFNVYVTATALPFCVNDVVVRRLAALIQGIRLFRASSDFGKTRLDQLARSGARRIDCAAPLD